MKLYYSPGACSMSPHIIALEAGIPVELVKVDLKDHKTESGDDFYKINPKGYVPALKLDDGHLLTEGPAIDQYLADMKPESHLLAAKGYDRYKTTEWLAFINSELHKTFSPLFNPALADDARKETRAKITKRFEYVNDELAGKHYLMGDTFTVADAYLFVILTWAHHMKVDLPENLRHFFDRVSQRPKVYQAMRDEGLVK